LADDLEAVAANSFRERMHCGGRRRSKSEMEKRRKHCFSFPRPEREVEIVGDEEHEDPVVHPLRRRCIEPEVLLVEAT